MDPEPAGAFEAIARLKEDLDVNVELASPADFLPRLPGWRERSLFVGQFGRLQVFHYDPESQALSKLERGHRRDLEDVRQMVRLGLVSAPNLTRMLAAIEPEMLRFPAIEPDELRAKVLSFVASLESAP
jgi:hypothetical protein